MKHTKKNKLQSPAYLRWKKQLIALKQGDLFTVKKLAQEAHDYFAFKKTGKVQLSLA